MLRAIAKSLALVAALIWSVPAMAAIPLEPPERFSQGYEGELILHVIDRSNVRKECAAAGLRSAKPNVAGCAFRGDGWCIVYVAKWSPRAPLADRIKHEEAHCSGWPPDHPD